MDDHIKQAANNLALATIEYHHKRMLFWNDATFNMERAMELAYDDMVVCQEALNTLCADLAAWKMSLKTIETV